MVLEHELMHQETLRYMLHRLPYAGKRAPAGALPPEVSGRARGRETVRIPAGVATLGARRGGIPFGWDNEFPEALHSVPAFTIDALPVTNGEFLEFVEAGGYREPACWGPGDAEWLASHEHLASFVLAEDRGRLALDRAVRARPAAARLAGLGEPRRSGGLRALEGAAPPDGGRVPPRRVRDARGTERAFPWGEAPPGPGRGNFGGDRDDPVPAGSRPDGASAWGVEELVGNGWEWTSTPFAGFDGFTPMASYPGYSADFFDGRHFVLKGASPATPAPLVRRTFRNWFQARYPYVYAKFRCVAP